MDEKISIELEGNYIKFLGIDGYDIKLDDCNNEKKILEWVDHLCEKSWVTTDMIRKFIRWTAGYHNISFHK